MAGREEAKAKARVSFSSEDEPVARPVAYSEENLAWYTYSVVTEPDKDKRLHGWRLIAKALSGAIPGEVITDYTTEGNLILDRTHHMRTVTTRPKGRNVLFDWRDKFEGEDGMFVEFIIEAINLCSFTVPGPRAMSAILEKVASIEQWNSMQGKEDRNVAGDRLSCIVPHFRIRLEPIGVSRRRPNAVQESKKVVSKWEAFRKTNTRAFCVDLVVMNECPDPQFSRSIAPFIVGSPRFYIADEALDEFIAGAGGDGLEDATSRQRVKAMIIAILSFKEGDPEFSKVADLVTYLQSQVEENRVLEVFEDGKKADIGDWFFDPYPL